MGVLDSISGFLQFGGGRLLVRSGQGLGELLVF